MKFHKLGRLTFQLLRAFRKRLQWFEIRLVEVTPGRLLARCLRRFRRFHQHQHQHLRWSFHTWAPFLAASGAAPVLRNAHGLARCSGTASVLVHCRQGKTPHQKQTGSIMIFANSTNTHVISSQNKFTNSMEKKVKRPEVQVVPLQILQNNWWTFPLAFPISFIGGNKQKRKKPIVNRLEYSVSTCI